MRRLRQVRKKKLTALQKPHANSYSYSTLQTSVHATVVANFRSKALRRGSISMITKKKKKDLGMVSGNSTAKNVFNITLNNSNFEVKKSSQNRTDWNNKKELPLNLQIDNQLIGFFFNTAICTRYPVLSPTFEHTTKILRKEKKSGEERKQEPPGPFEKTKRQV